MPNPQVLTSHALRENSKLDKQDGSIGGSIDLPSHWPMRHRTMQRSMSIFRRNAQKDNLARASVELVLVGQTCIRFYQKGCA